MASPKIRQILERTISVLFFAAFLSPIHLSCVRFIPMNPWSPVLLSMDILLIFLAIWGRDLAFLHDRPLARTVYRSSMVAVVLSLNFFLATVVHFLIRGLLLLFRLSVNPGLTYGLFLATAVLFTLWGLINARRLVVRTLRFDAHGFPYSWKGRRAVFFSDTHYGSLNGPDRARKLARVVMEQEPDLVFCGGDLFDGPGGDVEETIAELNAITAPLGVWAVLGNHDYFYLCESGSSRELLAKQRERVVMDDGPQSLLRRIVGALDWRFLENETEKVDGVVIAGVKNFSGIDYSTSQDFLKSLDATKPTIVLNHKPIQVEDAESAGADLQLSGHTHGGPLFPMNWIMRRVFSGRHFGTSRHGDLVLDTSSGSGTSLWYPRTAGSHEVVRLEFR